ncbi:hypothetical protein EV368DRAFT_84649 [Lentinula lateritia]|nr:hypothetical protein EV368DRAFT_84649 [Lentinula lateritia]
MLVSHNTITQWYDSPVLDNELHTVNLSNLVVDVDYAIVTVGQTTPLGSTSTIIVDVSNTEIKYQGSGWNPSGTSLMMNRGWANGATVRKFNLIARTPWIMLSDSDFLAVASQSLVFLNGSAPEALLSILLWTTKPPPRSSAYYQAQLLPSGNTELSIFLI